MGHFLLGEVFLRSYHLPVALPALDDVAKLGLLICCVEGDVHIGGTYSGSMWKARKVPILSVLRSRGI